MIVIVTGGREYRDFRRVNAVLDALHSIRPISIVRHGACKDKDGNMRGADAWAHSWAVANGVIPDPWPADWDNLGNHAGPIRNRQMAWAKPAANLCLAFPGGHGTRSMMGHANNAGILVIEVTP